MRIQTVGSHQIIDLRHRVLRAGLPRESAIFDGDDEPYAIHLAAILESQEVVGCCTFIRRAWNDAPAWQLRGMAVENALQRGAGQSRAENAIDPSGSETVSKVGVGSTLLIFAENLPEIRSYSSQLWCNARESARGFYEKHGWLIESGRFDIPTAGPHFRMSRRLN